MDRVDIGRREGFGVTGSRQARIQQSRQATSGTHSMSSKSVSWTLDSRGSFGSTLGQSLNMGLNQSAL
jgi:hypothetical protein